MFATIIPMVRFSSWILPALLVAAHALAAPLRLADVPPGRLRTQIAALSPKAQARARANLAAFDFQANDLPSLHADRAGNIFYACTFDLPPEAASAMVPAPRPAPAGAIPVSNAPAYHSRPGAPNIIFLDFDGHVVTNTRYNFTNLLDPGLLAAVTGLYAGADGPMSVAPPPLPDGPRVYYRLGVTLPPEAQLQGSP